MDKFVYLSPTVLPRERDSLLFLYPELRDHFMETYSDKDCIFCITVVDKSILNDYGVLLLSPKNFIRIYPLFKRFIQALSKSGNLKESAFQFIKSIGESR